MLPASLTLGVAFYSSSGYTFAALESVDNTQLRNEDVLICVRVADGSCDPDFKVKSELQFVKSELQFRAE